MIIIETPAPPTRERLVLVRQDAVPEVLPGRAFVASVRRGDRELAKACASAYEIGRPAVVAAAEAVDAWERPGSRERVACSLAAALGGLEAIVAEMRQRGGEAVPPLLSDARVLVSLVGGCPRG